MILPVGIENFEDLIKSKLDFVDKTLFIKEILDDRGTKVAVITRPRRFGKTLNLSMLQHFLAETVNGESTKGLFDGLKISFCGDEYLQHQGKYPVISMTFKDINTSSYEATVLQLHELMSELYIHHQYLLSSPALSDQHKRNFETILRKEANEAALIVSIKQLTECLYLHYRVKPWLLIDEYDTPIQVAYAISNPHPNPNPDVKNPYYDQTVQFMRGLFGAALKTNAYLEKAVITGILRIAKESLFSGLNNLEVYSLLREEYSEQFGFTESEVNEIVTKAKLSDKAAEIREWYNGYQIGKAVIYNPWSIVNCVKQKGILKPYWVNTSDNQLIKTLLRRSPVIFKSEFATLLSGMPVEKLIDEGVVFHYLNSDPAAVWNLLLMSGYLKPIATRQTDRGMYTELAIPNREVHNLYRNIIEQWLANGQGIEWYDQFIHSLLTGAIDEFKRGLETIITQITSYHDFAKEPEAFYQGLMLGFTVSLHNSGTYEIKSNRESGLGRFDIMLIPKDLSKLGIIIELKTATADENLTTVAEAAIKQIDEKKYTEEFKQRGIEKVIKIGIGFCGKAFELCSVEEMLDV